MHSARTAVVAARRWIGARRCLHASARACGLPLGDLGLDLSGLQLDASGDDPQGRAAAGNHGFDYDLAIIGGGSGGLACGREAARLGQKVALFDFVRPSHRGTKWGLGGTCVNVGCIPKKLMHYAAQLRVAMGDGPSFGWHVDASSMRHDWATMVENVQNYIRSSNFGYRAALQREGVAFFNEMARFVDPHTLLTTDAAGNERLVTAQHVLIAVGGRPSLPDMPGAELCVTSDDVFSLSRPPGKTLVVGGSYVALECAGFLTELGYPSTVMARSILLRGFDQEMARKVAEHMQAAGTRFLQPARPLSVARSPHSDRLLVHWRELGPSVMYGMPGTEPPAAGALGSQVAAGAATDAAHAVDRSEEFDTVLLAVGRAPETHALALQDAGVAVAPSGKIFAVDGQTSMDNVFAVGDVVEGSPELTPVAIQAGRVLARRLYGSSTERMAAGAVATTVFTPVEYACVGASEEEAMARLGADAVEVYHSGYDTLELQAAHRTDRRGEPIAAGCFSKVVCEREGRQRVLGIHLLGPHAGEVMQGFAAAMGLGLTKAHLDATVGIHPTHAEELTTLTCTKRSGKSPIRTSC